MVGMPFKFTFDKEICIQCGICGDSCPVNALDFTRPRHKNVEDENGKSDLTNDMTEYPIQGNKCIGCMICPEECPVSCIDIIEADKEPAYYPRQGPMMTEEPKKDAFGLLEFTKIRPTRMKSKDQWGNAFTWRPRRRRFQTQTWESMTHEGPGEAPTAAPQAKEAKAQEKAPQQSSEQSKLYNGSQQQGNKRPQGYAIPKV